ncbi:MAG: type II toxin-antitoxin system VapC family toxin [Moraxella equi]|nr:type II toxin-antitoxin system VapC family toxin [Moraxella equi]
MSYLLDTNIISEMNKPIPNTNVLAWLNQNPLVFISSITKAEILFGLEKLNNGKRKDELTKLINEVLALFNHRILPFCEKSANYYGKIVVQRQKQGKPILMADALIASIALANHLTVVTRNTKDFSDIDGLIVLNPFNP